MVYDMSYISEFFSNYRKWQEIVRRGSVKFRVIFEHILNIAGVYRIQCITIR